MARMPSFLQEGYYLNNGSNVGEVCSCTRFHSLMVSGCIQACFSFTGVHQVYVSQSIPFESSSFAGCHRSTTSRDQVPAGTTAKAGSMHPSPPVGSRVRSRPAAPLSLSLPRPTPPLSIVGQWTSFTLPC